MTVDSVIGLLRELMDVVDLPTRVVDDHGCDVSVCDLCGGAEEHAPDCLVSRIEDVLRT